MHIIGLKGVVKMLNKDKSVKLTHFIVRLCYFLLAAGCVAFPFLNYESILGLTGEMKTYTVIVFYTVVPAGFAALIALDKLLINIRKDVVFDKKNTSLLRLISWLCVYAGFVGLIAFILFLTLLSFIFETMIILSLGEFFMALVVRVVKNVFDAAIMLKEENDLTI